ncbi:MAG: metallophosphoesterase [Exilibacterium sp.]
MYKEGFQGYDVIGDVHGCAITLIRLLERLGYTKRAGVYRHRRRQAVFVGDVVDRGPRIREALHLVHDMVNAGAAQMAPTSRPSSSARRSISSGMTGSGSRSTSGRGAASASSSSGAGAERPAS